jgi:CBS domain-containing protein
MFVEKLLSVAREKLVTIADDAPLIQAAILLRSGTDLVVVTDSAGLLAGVITKTDVVDQISRCQGAGCTAAASLVMKRDVVLCLPGDLLENVWTKMRARSLKNIPFMDQYSRPVGILNARDMLQALLKESVNEEAIMRDYVMGVGYR